MSGLRSILRRGSDWLGGEPHRLPEKDDRVAVVDSLLSEVDFHVKELERAYREREQEERRLNTGVDYTWLMTGAPRSYEVPQLERLELEELCYKVNPTECCKVISLFRDAVVREPPVEELTRIMRSCIIQVLEQRPREETLTEWVSRRAHSLTSLKIKPPGRVAPSGDAEDIEMQAGTRPRETRAYSMPDFSVDGEIGSGSAYPV